MKRHSGLSCKKECSKTPFVEILFLLISFLLTSISIGAQPLHSKKGISKANKSTTLPSGYTQVGSTQLYYKSKPLPNGGTDFIGYYEGNYYSSTYNDYGYKLAIKVGNSSSARVDCINGTTNNGVDVTTSVEQQGELARVCYSVTNTNTKDVVVSLGTHADVMIGNNDKAPIMCRVDMSGQTYGLTMMDGNGAQLCVLFGSGLAGVTAVSDFWFGRYSSNTEPNNMTGNYIKDNYWMQENGSYDSGMGWCWKEQTIAAGSTFVFSYLIGVGEVNLEPYSSFEVTPDDPEGWNDLNRLHRLTLEGTYESPAGIDGIIEYAVEDNEDWTALTEILSSGDVFSASFVAMFNPKRSVHTIRFRTRDIVGNTTLLTPVEYMDVNFCSIGGIEDKIYTGDSIFQENLICELDTDQYIIDNYSNNVNAGQASFTVEGVFPKTIGRKNYTFNILPQPLKGGIVLAKTEFIYSGDEFAPEWQFSNPDYNGLKIGEDYTAIWTENSLPGQGTLTVTGLNNYTSTLSAHIHIDKAPLASNLYSLTFPEEILTYDEQPHGISVSCVDGVGDISISYFSEELGMELAQVPTLPGTYKVYLAISEGILYYGMQKTEVGSFTIQLFNAEQYELLGQMATDTEKYHMYIETRKKIVKFRQTTLSALQSGDLHTIFLAFSPMESLMAEVQASIDKYNQLADYITYIQQVQEAYGNMFTDNINSKISETAAELQSAYISGALNNEEVDLVWPHLQDMIRDELTRNLTPYIDEANELIEQGLIEDIHTGLYQTIQDVQALLSWTEYRIDDADHIKGLLLKTRILGVAARANVQDLAILRQAYQSMGGAKVLAGGWQFETPPYRLDGVTFAGGQATEVMLQGRNISGNIPTAFFMLPKIKALNLSNNLLTGDMATFHEQIIASGISCPVSVIDISHNHLSGNIGLLANCFTGLTSLNASDNCFEDVYPVIPSTVTSLDIGKQTITRVVPLHLANLSVNDIATKVPSILLYDHANQTWKTDINLQCTTDDNSWGMTMAYQNGQLSIHYVSEQNTYYGESGDTLNVAVLNNNGTREGSTFRIKLSFDDGDGNFDGQVNVLDLQTTINYMFEEYTSKPYNFTAANLWKDEVINVQDAVSLVNILLESNPASARPYRHGRRVTATPSDEDATVFVANGKLIVNAAEPVSSFDIVVATGSEYNANETLASAGFTCSVKQNGNEVHLVGYSLNGATLPAGENVLGTLNEGVVKYSMLADTEAKEITTPFGNNPTGIHSATSANQKLNEVYIIPLGTKHSIVIDANGKKYMVTEK